MNLLCSLALRISMPLFALGWLVSPADGADAEQPAISATELAGRLSALRDGASYVRLRLQVKQPVDTTKITLQVQIKERRSKTAADVVYQVLWPKERKGEAVLLQKTAGSPPAGSLFMPPDKPTPLNFSQMTGSLFGSDLAYEDVIENFFSWENQAIVGNETVDRVNCLILESRPGKGESSIYASVRSWIDPRRLVPLRVEKYLPGGRLARRIQTTRIATDDKGRAIPAGLTVRGPREDSLTELDGSRIRHDVSFTDREFTPGGLGEVSVPPSTQE
jgi:Outer membrane lipoprotein-sorting protein